MQSRLKTPLLFDLDLIEHTACIAAKEDAAAGVHWPFSTLSTSAAILAGAV